jgi:plasmid maintenance system antidote protein VapI
VCEIVNGKKRITAETAKQLEAAGLGEARAWVLVDVRRQLDEANPSVGAVRARAVRRRARNKA